MSCYGTGGWDPTWSEIHIGVTIWLWCERTCLILAETEELRAAGRSWRATHIVSRVQLQRHLASIRGRKPPVLRRKSDLIDEVPEIRLIQIHEFVHVSQIEPWSCSGW